MNLVGLRAPENQSAKFVELFFDIIFVFSVVQIVELLHGHFDFLTVLESILIFWLVWWSWTQFTWALNIADTESDVIEAAILLATAVSFFMAISIPDAFGDGALKFVGAYLVTRVIGLTVYSVIATTMGRDALKAGLTFGFISLTGMVTALAGAILGGTLQYILWSLVIVLDVLTTFISARTGSGAGGWYLQPDHFVERHGLFMIIVLGETLIINARGLGAAIENDDILFLAVAAVLVTLGFWWSYYAHVKHKLEEVMVELGPENDGIMARDIYSLGHFPVIFGVIAFASALEEVINHPTDPVNFETRMAFAVGTLLFISGLGLVIFRATGKLISIRFIVPLVTGILILALPEITPLVILLIILGGLAIIVIYEEQLEFLEKHRDSQSTE